MNKWKFALLIVIVLVLAFVVHKTGLLKTMSSEELQSSIETVNVETKWVSKYYRSWPPKLILVPAISFRVKNVANKPLRYINFEAIFKFKDELEILGSDFLGAIREKAIKPGETSDVITLKSNFGVEGKKLSSFKDNPEWKTVIVKLFAQSSGSQYIQLKELEVSKNIDFKESEPVGIEKKEKNK